MTQLFANNGAAVLSAPLAAAALTLSVVAGQGARFPAPAAGDYFLVTLFQIVNGDEGNYEIVKVTARTVDTLTIVRAQEGTTARSYAAGDRVQIRNTAETLRWLQGGAQGGSPTNLVFHENDATVSDSYTIRTGKNAMSAGPITIANGVTVTVPDGSVWTIV